MSTVSSNYHEEVRVNILNLSDKPLYIHVGTRIAQIVIERQVTSSIREVLDFDEIL